MTEERLRVLETELESVVGVVTGMTTVIGALIATHPDHEKLLMRLAGAVEVTEQTLGKVLTEKQRRVARYYVEQLAALKPVGAMPDLLRATLGDAPSADPPA